MKKDTIDLIVSILVIIGALNWGLVGLLNFNLVTAIFKDSLLTKLTYDIVGLAAIYMIYGLVTKK